MASPVPLSPLDDRVLNARSPLTARKESLSPKNNDAVMDKHEDITINWDDAPPSSPFQSEVPDSRQPSAHFASQPTVTETNAIFEDPSPAKAQAQDNNPMSFDITLDFNNDKENGATQVDESNITLDLATPKRSASPAKRPQSSRKQSAEADAFAMPPPSLLRKRAERSSPSKSSPLKKMLKTENTSPLPPTHESLFEDVDIQPMQQSHNMQAMDETNIDDTCFSTFSEIPEMTLFAKLGEARSPTKTPRAHVATTPSTRYTHNTSRSPSPTPRGHRQRSPVKDSGNTTSLLLDFTTQIESFASRAHNSPSKSSTQPNLLTHLQNARSPHKHRRETAPTPQKSSSLLDLLDFDLPPPSTPKSIPTISVREMESLKSQYLSQLSSLKATLSGREAEVESLKKAIMDAERRAGEAQERVREEEVRREHAEQASKDWEKRSAEVERVLATVKEEVIRSEGEKEELAGRVEDAERRAEEAQLRAQDAEQRALEAETKFAAMPRTNPDGSKVDVDENEVQRLVQAQLDAKIEAVSRELHAVYKKKHETKVATLKKSYEARGEKRCAELQAHIGTLTQQCQDLQAAKDETFSGSISPSKFSGEKVSILEARIEEQKARIAGYESEMHAVRQEYSQLLRELEQERVEKGELVAAVDEMLALQATEGAQGAIEDFRKSISRPSMSMASGLKTPGSIRGESRIGRGMTPATVTRASHGKSRIMGNIERMGMMRNAD